MNCSRNEPAVFGDSAVRRAVAVAPRSRRRRDVFAVLVGLGIGLLMEVYLFDGTVFHLLAKLIGG